MTKSNWADYLVWDNSLLFDWNNHKNPEIARLTNDEIEKSSGVELSHHTPLSMGFELERWLNQFNEI